MENHNQARQVSSPIQRLTSVIGQLGLLIDEETAALKLNNIENLEQFSERKNRILLEFNRAMIAAGNVSGLPSFLNEVDRLRARLEGNKSALKQQLAAVKEYSIFLESEARRHETDGTYSRSISYNGMER